MNILVRSAAASLAGGLALATAVLPAFAEDVPIPESAAPLVGMAYDPGNEELWLAGADADQGTLVDATGEKEVTFTADLVSVQALSWSGDRLWVGDIGDPRSTRDTIVVYRLGSTDGGRTTYHAYDFQYEDQPQDAQAMLISGRGNIYIVTGGESPGVYRVRGDISREDMNTLVRVYDAPEGVTDGVFLSDGSTMALRTTAGIEYIDALRWEPLVTDTIVGAPEGESIARGADDELFVGGNPAVRVSEVPGEDVTTTVAPQVAESPSAEPSTTAPTATGSAEPAAPEPAAEEGPARAGTITALALAAAVALAAGVVTYLWRN
ncbi:hypothetical protein ACX1DX_13765 [Tessaracoccus sp. Y36]